MEQKSYKVITISTYDADLARLDELVWMLRQRKILNTNRSSVIRYAIRLLHTAVQFGDAVPHRLD